MTDLLIAEPASQGPQEADAGTAFGGLPVAPAGAQPEWPACASCGGAMQFLGRLLIPPEAEPPPAQGGDLLLLFLCMSDPGLCSSWEADGGSNRALVVPAWDLAPFPPPPGGVTLRETRCGARVVSVPEADYDQAREEWGGGGASRREVLGQLLGQPSWLQGEERPDCDRCGRAMRFVAQLEEGPDAETAMNFGGGGCAYVFDCACQGRSAKLLWQC